MITTPELTPMPGFALIKLNKKYESGLSTDREKYSMNTTGTLLSVTFDNDFDISNVNKMAIIRNAIGKTVYFTPFEDGDIIKLDNEDYVFVPTQQIRGAKQ
jgi:co-chaperonin GroES (HSP10)